MVHILIVDDHPLVCLGIRQVLEAERGMTVSGEAADGQEALEILRKRTFGLVILDLSLPDIHGLEVLEEIHGLYPQLPVLVLTIHSNDEYAIRALRSGASAFCPKDCAPELFLEATRKLAKGGKFLTASQGEKLLDYLDSPKQTLHDHLSNREFQILKLIGQGISLKEIAERLTISPKTVSSYRCRVFRKMPFKSNADATRYCMENQLIIEKAHHRPDLAGTAAFPGKGRKKRASRKQLREMLAFRPKPS